METMANAGKEFVKKFLALQPNANVDEQLLADLVNLEVAESKAQVMSVFSDMYANEQAFSFALNLKKFAENLESEIEQLNK
ncbi:hypothetical protein [Vibrio anguillarum]|nr:hypothetical protein [Vibrio anguillarum]